uniref:Uncharacterized protein n=1 Tax=Parascaris equorum TaxID=6256 RepID=A0A914S638_PAREQ
MHLLHSIRLPPNVDKTTDHNFVKKAVESHRNFHRHHRLNIRPSLRREHDTSVDVPVHHPICHKRFVNISTIHQSQNRPKSIQLIHF